MLNFNLEYYSLQQYKVETDFKWSFAFCRVGYLKWNRLTQYSE